MAEEEVVTAAASAPSDHKRKLDQALDEQHPDDLHSGAAAPDASAHAHASGSPDADSKRPRLDHNPGIIDPSLSVNGNGYPEESGSEEAPREVEEAPIDQVGDHFEAVNASSTGNASESCEDEEKPPSTDEQPPSAEEQPPSAEEQPPSAEEQPPSLQLSDDALAQSRRIEVPNNKVGVLIGKAGDTIRYLQYNSGAKIQIMRDADADMSSPMRPVELIGSFESIDKAEKLIRDVIAEADAGGSPSLIARGIATAQVTGIAEQIEIKVPNDKVGLIIGKGGETIKGLQTRSGARIQLIPQHLPEGDESKERIVRVTGDKRQIDMATDMIRDVMKQLPRPWPLSGSLGQQMHRSRGPAGLPHWGSRTPYPGHAMGYGYQQRGPYTSQNSPYPPPSYGGYPHSQMAPRGNFGSGWEYRQQNVQGPPHHGGSYDYYGGHSSGQGNTPHSGPAQSIGHGVGPPQSQVVYNYGQPHGPEYGHQGTYTHAGPQQNYGHGYNEPQTQHPPYGGGHTGLQPAYPQAGQSGYVQPGKLPGYGMPPQPYGAPRASQPGDAPYQSAQPYGPPNTQQQQTYQYPSSGPIQPTYPTYGSVPTSDGFNQSSNAYAQQGQQAGPGYGQPPNYGQTGSYTSTQQSYPEQSATSTAAYGYQAPQDTGFSAGPGPVYSAASGQAQPAYAQQPTNQPAYDQSAQQPGNYGGVATSAPPNYGNTVSPQPGGYSQYDSSTQVPLIR